MFLQPLFRQFFNACLMCHVASFTFPQGSNFPTQNAKKPLPESLTHDCTRHRKMALCSISQQFLRMGKQKGN